MHRYLFELLRKTLFKLYKPIKRTAYIKDEGIEEAKFESKEYPKEMTGGESIIANQDTEKDIATTMNEEVFDKEYFAQEIQKIVDELESSRETAIIFNEKPCDTIPIGKTKTGGLPDLPPSVEYPAREAYTDENGNFHPAVKMTLVCQINCEELHACYSSNYIPETGMVYLFWSGDDQEYFKKKYGVNTLRVFYWNGDMSTLIRTPADEATELYDEYMVTFSLQEEIYAEDIDRRVEDLLGELEDECNAFDMDYYDTEEYDILSELPERCEVSGATKLFGYRAGMIYSGECFDNSFLQFDYSCVSNHGAIWYLFIGVNGLSEAKNISGWTELKTSLSYDVD